MLSLITFSSFEFIFYRVCNEFIFHPQEVSPFASLPEDYVADLGKKK